MLRSCPRESELSDLLARGRWPQAATPELRDHVHGCRGCSDLALVKDAFQQARAETIHNSQPIGSAGALWWRAQLRRRNAAVERVGRPLVNAQIFALLVSLLAAVGFAGFEARHGIGWLDWLQGLPHSATTQFADLSSAGFFNSGWFWLLAASAAAALALLAGAIAYLAAEKQ
ncbi:MAG TPA: hypothetical protein VFB43_10105 [Terracidiphilus sp.]|nr:hypothetical protein [Terracidiphilus sp.]